MLIKNNHLLLILISLKIAKPNLYKLNSQILIMGTALVTIKIMPESPEADLEAIQEKAKQIVAENGGEKTSTKTEPVAFGLNAIVINFALDESKSVDDIENPLKNINDVSSAEVTDFRRAFG